MSHYIPAQGAGVVGPSVTTGHSVNFSHATDYSKPLRYDCSLWRPSRWLNQMNL